jgi:hypothetical protein
VLAKTHRLLTLGCVAALLLLLLLSIPRAGAQTAADTGIPDEAVLVTTPDAIPGARPLATSDGGYLSPTMAAPRPFTHLMLRWEAVTPVPEQVFIEIRASLDGQSWTDWGTALKNDDLWAPEDGDTIFWSQEIYAGDGARFWQVRATLHPDAAGARPELRRISVYTVDGRYGPAEPAPDLLPEGMVGIAGGPAKPAVVSRTAWGSPDGQGSPEAPPEYRSVRHMVVHHTADSNTLAPGQRWADRVRAIWSFHAKTRGWGDIGYNYLIDPNGVIYEGRAGGDDAVGFHDTANYGSMGVSLIGTYTTTAPTGQAVNSLVNLLAWKAGQKDIDPFGSSVYAGCVRSQYCAPFNPGGVVEHIAGHRDVTPGRTTCPGDALEGLLPQIRQRVAEGGGPPPPVGKLDLLNVRYERTSLAAGDLLKVIFTVHNSGSAPLESQAPEAGRDPDSGAYLLAESYAYDEGDCFLGAPGGGTPSFPKESGHVRLMLGPVEEARQPACAGGTGGYPWRWGLNGTLAPGETRDVVGYVRLRTPGTITLRAGAINEWVAYLAQDVAAQPITVSAERQMPAPAAYDEQLRPLAHVYRMADLPGNLIARSADSALFPRGDYAGSFPWMGETVSWGGGGPLTGAPELTDRFMVEQTRVFVAPRTGAYTFRVTADDSAWLWVGGQRVVGGTPQPAGGSLTGVVNLTAGERYVVSFRGIEQGGWATLGYDVQLPDDTVFIALPDDTADRDGAPAQRLGATFRRFYGLSLVADDQGGSGVASVRHSLNGGPWQETPGPIARVGALPDGLYSVRYQAVDGQGNLSEERTLSFAVNAALEVRTLYLPLVVR